MQRRRIVDRRVAERRRREPSWQLAERRRGDRRSSDLVSVTMNAEG